ncbi:ribonuclease HI family protein [Halobacillus karajensis]|uniref:14.7 kDa ribonuclease H-like protein n=1 Tax=Halobacillus karajensis TaxID=195088 RepID=A0A024P291_9BACI|nr:ribonuclease HI family protein [Halobacillus karajensis]CDQ19554.1 14.7 kDa ribonuclease H-like protein [Halobacillus karajensis]CDQ22016.1 14.7 kDa ribonuclease H-like protein [Halobacillus karajensis]CDQ27857.1 14.7 kDa ribonuclease H-like protein [Halobacillus karajensis]
MIEVYTDAACSGDPGPSAAGIIIKKKQMMKEYQFYLGSWTNHEAEFLAMIRALELCQKIYPNEIISIRSDSQIAVDTMDKRYTKNEKFLPLYQQILELEENFSLVFYKWIPDKQNKNADRLARQCLQHKQYPDHL